MVSTKLIVAILIQLFYHVLGERIQDKMYNTIYGSICFRRLNATHSTGCGSAFGGSNGVLHLIETNEDFDFVINKPPAPPYTLIMTPALFNRTNIMNLKLKAAENVAGIVLIDNRTNVYSFSHESKCPNQYGGLLKSQTCDVNKTDETWNPFGSGLLHEDFPFPMFFVKDEEHIKSMIDCYRKFNGFDRPNQHRRPLCSIQIKSFMSAAVNSVVCMRRTKYLNNMNPQRYCDPLQGKNVYATLFEREIIDKSSVPDTHTKSAEEFIVVAARFDTTSMFDGVGLGALDSLVPSITLMSTAHTLVKMLPTNKTSKNWNILFMLFNGESYDYIGSQRFVYDMENGEFPSASTNTHQITLENIKLFVDIASLDNPNSISIYQYRDFPLANQLISIINSRRENFNINILPKLTENLPPTSSQTFLRDNDTFPALIFYSDTNKNKFYHSIYDDNKNFKEQYHYYNTSKDFTTLSTLAEPNNFSAESIQIAVRNISTLFAHSLHEFITGNAYDENAAANPYLIDELLQCYLITTKCRLFRASMKDASAVIGSSSPPHRYVSVQGSLSFETALWTYRVLGFLTGRHSSESETNCTQLPLAWYAGINGTGECLRTTQNLSNAYSPAFTIDNYDWSSGRYSTWTESTWSEINARIFLKPSVSHEALSLAIGFVVLVISFVFVFLVNSKSDVLFGDSTSSVNALTLPSQC